MHHQPGEITFMWKDASSITGNCPALYGADGGYVVQGKIALPSCATRPAGLRPTETCLWVPADVIDRISPDALQPHPARLAAAPGGYVVRGALVHPGVAAQLRDLGDDETAVFIPAVTPARQLQPA